MSFEKEGAGNIRPIYCSAIYNDFHPTDGASVARDTPALKIAVTCLLKVQF